MKKEELLHGVQCEVCSILPMFKLKKGWYCSNCKAISKVAHKFALKDYALLIGDTCTNMQLKKFLNVQSSATVNRLLQTINIPHIGDNKGRIYDLTSFQS